MNEILVLYTLNKAQSTMYGLSKYINKNYGSITKPSFGTLQPILKKFEAKKLVFSSKFYTEGGKPYFYYSITKEGLEYLKEKLIKSCPSNPSQILTMTRIKLSCCDILDNQEKQHVLKSLKTTLSKIKNDAETIQKKEDSSGFYYKMVLENSICEYKNLINLIEVMENACNS